MKFSVENLSTGTISEVFLDCYAIWEDLGNGMLQPTRSTANIHVLHNLKSGQAIVTGGTRYKRLDEQVYRWNTSMNNCVEEPLRLPQGPRY